MIADPAEVWQKKMVRKLFWHCIGIACYRGVLSKEEVFICWDANGEKCIGVLAGGDCQLEMQTKH